MAYIVNFEQSNKADWRFTISATDADTGEDIDFSTLTAASFVVKDENNCQKLEATLASGITTPVDTTLEIIFLAPDMETLCAGSYKVGCVYNNNGEVVQLLTGTVSIYDGVAKV